MHGGCGSCALSAAVAWQAHHSLTPQPAHTAILSRVYGSPQLDALLDAGGAERLQELLQELRRAF